MSLTGGNVLLTGATGGIGHALARAFAARGAKLVLTGRRAELLERLAAELGARVIAADLARPDEVQRLAADVGDLDVAIFNAAVPGSGLLLDYTQEQIDRALDVNLRSPIALTRALAPAMVRRGRGHILFVSSLQGKVALPGSSLYTATKFGLRGFSLALRQDLRSTGVGVSVLLPGFISDAGLFADTGAKLPPGTGTRSPEQVAAAALRAVDRNRAELHIAPPALTLGATVGGVVPQLAATVSRLAGSEKVAAEIGAGQLDKR